MRDERYYVHPDTESGDSIPWGDLSNDPEIVRSEWWIGDKACVDDAYLDGARLRRVTYEGVLFTPIPYCTFGDYDNSTATERSNHRVMRERFPWLVHVYGSHGSEMVGYLGTLTKRNRQHRELIEAIDELDIYPILDESDESELEMEMEWAEWCDWGRRDFAKDLSAALDEIDPTREHDLDVPHEDNDAERSHKDRSPLTLAIDEVWHRGSDALNINGGSGCTIEGGGNVHFYVDEWIERATREPQEHRYGEHVSRSEFDVRDMLLAISRAYGTIKPATDTTNDLNVRRMCTAIWLGWNGTEAPRDLVRQCTDPDTCAVFADWIDERTPMTHEQLVSFAQPELAL